MTRPIEWHKECLNNRRKTMKDLKKARDNFDKIIKRDQKEILQYYLKIRSAENEGIESFDLATYSPNKKTAMPRLKESE